MNKQKYSMIQLDVFSMKKRQRLIVVLVDGDEKGVGHSDMHEFTSDSFFFKIKRLGCKLFVF